MKINLNELRAADENLQNSLKESFKIGNHFFPSNSDYRPITPKYIVCYFQGGQIEIINTTVNK